MQNTRATLCCLTLLVSPAFCQEGDPKNPVIASKAPAPVAAATADAAAIAREAAQLRTLLSQSADKLNELARERAFKALADLDAGRKLARCSTHEKNIQRTRLEWLGKVQKAEKERDELRAELESEMDQIRQQFSDDSAECDRQLLFVINRYRPRVLQLKDEIQQFSTEAEGTDGKLAVVRRQMISLERDHRLAQRGLPFKAKQPAEVVVNKKMLAEFDLDVGDIDLDALSAEIGDSLNEVAGPQEPVDSETVRQAMEELKGLF